MQRPGRAYSEHAHQVVYIHRLAGNPSDGGDKLLTHLNLVALYFSRTAGSV
jgi:hypothetical protein